MVLTAVVILAWHKKLYLLPIPFLVSENSPYHSHIVYCVAGVGLAVMAMFLSMAATMYGD